MLAFKRTDDGWVDRSLSSLSPAEAQHRLRLGARAFDAAELIEATAQAVPRMDAALRAELARTLGIAAGPRELGEMFFEPSLPVDSSALADALRDRADGEGIANFLVRNPRAASAYPTTVASRLLGTAPPPRRSPLPLALFAGLGVFGAGALIALGALVIPKEDDLPLPPPPAKITAPAAREAAAPRHQRPAQRPHRAAPRRPAAPRVAYVPPPAPAPAIPHERSVVTHPKVHRPSPHPPPRRHEEPTQVANASDDQTPAPRMTVWRRFFGWIHVRKHP